MLAMVHFYFSVAVTYNCVYIYYFYSLRSWFGCQTSHRRFQTSNTSTIFPNKFASSIERLLLSRRDCLNRHAFTWFISILIGFQKNCRCTSEGRDLAPRCVKTHTDNSSNPNHKSWRSPAAIDPLVVLRSALLDQRTERHDFQEENFEEECAAR